MQFGKFEEILQTGYEAATRAMEQWDIEGKLPSVYESAGELRGVKAAKKRGRARELGVTSEHELFTKTTRRKVAIDQSAYAWLFQRVPSTPLRRQLYGRPRLSETVVREPKEAGMIDTLVRHRVSPHSRPEKGKLAREGEAVGSVTIGTNGVNLSQQYATKSIFFASSERLDIVKGKGNSIGLHLSSNLVIA
ncbi:hypothetical protein M422DRAFT_269560 [Sphaerobolus stellatus SS14]|uniref:Uncharacterized protein n=1 Tax=Sphaerobolus stellatus (strain SS14) TaxID=990650 RepID=A0A0C9UVB5_SPHS4|nr:hypothetical protein M422DRAFT_269560 [Sphaerobolus stellatus SS14]